MGRRSRPPRRPDEEQAWRPAPAGAGSGENSMRRESMGSGLGVSSEGVGRGAGRRRRRASFIPCRCQPGGLEGGDAAGDHGRVRRQAGDQAGVAEGRPADGDRDRRGSRWSPRRGQRRRPTACCHGGAPRWPAPVAWPSVAPLLPRSRSTAVAWPGRRLSAPWVTRPRSSTLWVADRRRGRWRSARPGRRWTEW